MDRTHEDRDAAQEPGGERRRRRPRGHCPLSARSTASRAEARREQRERTVERLAQHVRADPDERRIDRRQTAAATARGVPRRAASQ